MQLHDKVADCFAVSVMSPLALGPGQGNCLSILCLRSAAIESAGDAAEDGALSTHSSSAKGPVPVIGENTGKDMPDMRVPADATPSALSSGSMLTPRQVIAATVSEVSASMQVHSVQEEGPQIGSRPHSSQPSLIPNGKHGGAQALHDSLQSHRGGSPLATPPKAASSSDI